MQEIDDCDKELWGRKSGVVGQPNCQRKKKQWDILYKLHGRMVK